MMTRFTVRFLCTQGPHRGWSSWTPPEKATRIRFGGPADESTTKRDCQRTDPSLSRALPSAVRGPSQPLPDGLPFAGPTAPDCFRDRAPACASARRSPGLPAWLRLARLAHRNAPLAPRPRPAPMGWVPPLRHRGLPAARAAIMSHDGRPDRPPSPGGKAHADPEEESPPPFTPGRAFLPQRVRAPEGRTPEGHEDQRGDLAHGQVAAGGGHGCP